MTQALLQTLVDANAFLPSPLSDDLIACHVPFDELIQQARVESALEEYARRSVATAVVGPSGCGKSAVTAWVYDRIAFDFAPIRAPVFYEAEETVREPGAFARYLVQRLVDEASHIASLSETERAELLRQSSERVAMPTRTIGHSTTGSIEVPWLLKGEAAREVSTTLGSTSLAGTTGAVLGGIDRVVDAITAQGLTPIFVLDDTDRWLQVGNVDRRDLVGCFFGTIVRMLAERGCGVVVAVHETYLEMPEYAEGTHGFLTEQVVIPSLPAAEQLAHVLDHRIRLQVEAAAVDDVFDVAALQRLYDYYTNAGKRSLRWALQVAHSALGVTAAASGGIITERAVDDAAAA